MTVDFVPDGPVTIDQIHESYVNGQKRQMSVMINYYGVDFWKDLALWLNERFEDMESKYEIYTSITISYSYWFPHINQQ